MRLDANARSSIPDRWTCGHGHLTIKEALKIRNGGPISQFRIAPLLNVVSGSEWKQIGVSCFEAPPDPRQKLESMRRGAVHVLG